MSSIVFICCMICSSKRAFYVLEILIENPYIKYVDSQNFDIFSFILFLSFLFSFFSFFFFFFFFFCFFS